MKVIQYIKTIKRIDRTAFASGAILFLLAIAMCLPISNGEQETQAATGTAQESSLTLTVAQDTASLDLNVTNSSGTFATSSAGDEASFNVVTNNYTGYTLSISASGKIGVYYNYCAASAGTYCWGNGTSYTGSPESDPKTDTGYDIDGDICPAGWRMPTGGAIATGTIAQGEYQSLANAITGGTSTSLSGDNATAFRSALSTPLSGIFDRGSASYQGFGGSGSFWSSTWYSGNRMYYLSVNSSRAEPQLYSNRSDGYSVRCILQ